MSGKGSILDQRPLLHRIEGMVVMEVEPNPWRQPTPKSLIGRRFQKMEILYCLAYASQDVGGNEKSRKTCAKLLNNKLIKINWFINIIDY